MKKLKLYGFYLLVIADIKRTETETISKKTLVTHGLNFIVT